MVLIDGAHNIAGIKSLKRTLMQYFSKKKKILVIGILEDKDYKEILKAIVPVADIIICTAPENPRALSAAKLSNIISDFFGDIVLRADSKDANIAKKSYSDMSIKMYTEENIENAVKIAQSLAASEDIIIFAGSLYMIGHVREMQTVKEGDPIVSLSGSDVRKTIEEKLEKIREKESQLTELYTKAGQMEVKSPMDGVIASWDTQLGAQIRPGEWMGYVFNTGDMGMWVEVDDIDVLMIQQGSPVKVSVDALPGETFEGEVMHVSTMGKDMKGITQFAVDIRVKGGPNLRPGMQAKAYIDAGSAENVILVPLEAIFEEDGIQKVEVLNPDGTTKAVVVKLGLMNDRAAEVKSGLKEGELVITGSSADLLPSQHIGTKDTIIPSKDSNDDNNNEEQKAPAVN
jgi:hypothetical protein